MAEKWVRNLMDNADFNSFTKKLWPYLNELKNFHFSLSNPLLWVIFCVSFLLLSRQWGTKKAFSFCLIITVVLLATTLLENYIPSASGAAELFDFTIIKLISIFVISLITIYYFFIKNI